MRKSIKCLLACVATIALACITTQAKNVTFTEIKLVSDMSNTAQLQDPDLVNAWGVSPVTYNVYSSNGLQTNVIITTNSTSVTNLVIKRPGKTNIVIVTTIHKATNDIIGPHVIATPTTFFWVNANATSNSLVYNVTNDALGNPVVTKMDSVPVPGDFPSGLAANKSILFNGDNVIFASEDGTLSGWGTDSNNMASLDILAQRSTAVYKGVAIVNTVSNGPVVLAANFSEGTVDEYGTTNLILMAQFVDTTIPAGYAPFNVQNVDGVVLVTYAVQDSLKVDAVPGPGRGIIDIFNPDTRKFFRFATGTAAGGKEVYLNTPYGLALAPDSWGNFASLLLVANTGDGTITAFNDNGKSKGQLLDDNNETIVIDGLWGLAVGTTDVGGPDNLYFTAGANGGTNLFGVLQPPPGKQKKK